MMKTNPLARLVAVMVLFTGLLACNSSVTPLESLLTVKMVTPTDGTTNVTVNPTIQLLFNMPVQNVNSSTVSLHQGSIRAPAIPISSITLGANNTYTFRPTTELPPSSVIYVVVDSEITSTDGSKHLGLTIFNFKTAALWINQVGAVGGDTEGLAISVDDSGNSYVTGRTNLGISGQTQSNGTWDLFIAKYDLNGTLKWTKQVGDSGSINGTTIGTGIANDEFGNNYVTGYTIVGILGQAQNGNYDYFIAKYDTNGNLKWAKQVGTTGGDTEGRGISVDGYGNSYVIGYTNVAISGQKQHGAKDYFIAKYDSNGTLKRTQQVGASGGSIGGMGIDVDSLGNSYVTGYTNVGIFGQNQNGDTDYFIAKYDPDGTLKWSKQVGTNGGNTLGISVSADYLGNSYVTGQTDKGISGQAQNGNHDYFVAKYDSEGSLKWTKQVGASGGETAGSGISVDIAGNSYVTGFSNIAISGLKQNGGCLLAKVVCLQNILRMAT